MVSLTAFLCVKFSSLLLWIFCFAARSSTLRSVIAQMLEPDFTKRPTVDQILAMSSMRKVGASLSCWLQNQLTRTVETLSRSWFFAGHVHCKSVILEHAVRLASYPLASSCDSTVIKPTVDNTKMRSLAIHNCSLNWPSIQWSAFPRPCWSSLVGRSCKICQFLEVRLGAWGITCGIGASDGTSSGH